MFCEKCGTKNDDNATTCSNCGAKLPQVEIFNQPIQTQDNNIIKNQQTDNIYSNNLNAPNNTPMNAQPQLPFRNDDYQQTAYPNQQQSLRYIQPQFKKNISTKQKHVPVWLIILLVSITILICGLIIFYFVNEHKNNPSNLAVEYANAVLSGDYDKAYSMIEDNDFEITKDELSDFYKEKYGVINIPKSSIKIGNCECVNISQTKAKEKYVMQYTLVYKIPSSNKNYIMIVNMSVQNKPAYNFFTTYKAAIDDQVCQNVHIIAPKGSTVSVDNNVIQPDITDTYDIENSYGKLFVCYPVNTLLIGKHNITVKSDFLEDVNETKYLSSHDELVYNDLQVSSSQSKALEQKSIDFIKDLYSYAFSGKSLDDLSKKYKMDLDEETKNAYNTAYNDYCKNNIESFEITNCDVLFCVDHSDNESLQYNIILRINYVYKSQGQSYKSSRDTSVYHVYEDGEWKIIG